MADRVASTIARNASGKDVTVATLKGEEEYYPKIIDHLNETETVEFIILLTTNSGFTAEPVDVPSVDTDEFDEYLEKIRSSEHRFNAMVISNQRVLLISGDSGHTVSEHMEIPLESIESVHGSANAENYTIRIVTHDDLYSIDTAKIKRLSDFREAMAYLSSSIETDHPQVR